MANNEDLFKKIIAHSKEYGFIFQSSEIYDGLSAVYDYAQNGVELKNNIKNYWWKSMVQMNENIVGIDSAIFMHPTVWKASGHLGAFNDPMIDNKDSKKRYRADVLVEDFMAKIEGKIKKDETYHKIIDDIDYKILEVEFVKEVSEWAKKLRVESKKGNRYVFVVKKKNLKKWIKCISNDENIKDVNIRSPSLEEIIKAGW